MSYPIKQVHQLPIKKWIDESQSEQSNRLLTIDNLCQC